MTNKATLDHLFEVEAQAREEQLIKEKEARRIKRNLEVSVIRYQKQLAELGFTEGDMAMVEVENEDMESIINRKVAEALALRGQDKVASENEKHKASTLEALDQLRAKVISGDVTAMAFVSVGPNPQPSFGYAASGGPAPLLGELEVMKARICQAVIAQQPQA